MNEELSSYLIYVVSPFAFIGVLLGILYLTVRLHSSGRVTLNSLHSTNKKNIFLDTFFQGNNSR